MPESLFLINLKADVCKFIKKETLAQVFACCFAKSFRTTVFIEHLQWLFLEILSKYEHPIGTLTNIKSKKLHKSFAWNAFEIHFFSRLQQENIEVL